ncbi:hypothetical protein K1T71_006972 [Dendrolimus kikuchii]|uniref:Uncharacterized protein n=1 Tax=Dendrolimus kikuchii TaxID=765133 RepID=A0ACC1CZ63_9NEOP|nr:hypothetical protein K1T71_006972 [Dendrolimus kikuchii]
MWRSVVLLAAFGFTKSLTTSFDVRGIINGNRMASVPLGITLGSGELDVQGICVNPGMTCQNCTHAITCVALPVGWLLVPLEDCQEGYTCNAHLGKCTKDHVPECSSSSKQYKHTCEQVGIFPDAHDCRKFHLCSPPEGLPDGRPAEHREALCPRHYGYNPETAQCSIKLKNGQCSEKPVPDCTKVGQADVLNTSPNHYYVCLMKNNSLYPQIFICPHGWYFYDGYCHPEPKVVPENSSESASSSSEGNADTTKRPKSKNKSNKENKNKDVTTDKASTTTTEEVKLTTTRIDSFFSTDKPVTYAADTFLADKFDLTNYESIADNVGAEVNDDFVNSFERDYGY